MNKLLDRLRNELELNKDVVYQAGVTNFFREDIVSLGVRTPVVRKLANRYFKEVRGLSKSEVFDLCGALWKHGTMEEGIVASAWAFKMKKEFDATDIDVFDNWIERYVKNWAHCDDFCTHSVGYLVNEYPELVSHLKRWAKSRNRWMRRASAVSLVYPFRGPKPLLKSIFDIADILLLDEDDMVQKGYGWMLKVAADHHRDEVFEFVMNRKDRMPRTALRYAIEKMPNNLKEKAMKK